MKMANLQRAARLGRALEDWDEFEKAFNAKRRADRPCGIEISVGRIEDDDGELVQPDHGIVTDAETGKLIVAAAQKIIAAELKKLGVTE